MRSGQNSVARCAQQSQRRVGSSSVCRPLTLRRQRHPVGCWLVANKTKETGESPTEDKVGCGADARVASHEAVVVQVAKACVKDRKQDILYALGVDWGGGAAGYRSPKPA